jgi:nucleoside-diphosphate-sugar epimerase
MRIVVLGALGEVGSAVSAALLDRGHRVIASSSRAPLVGLPDVLSTGDALTQLEQGAFDVVVNASGRGDRRGVERTGLSAAEALGGLPYLGGVPAILLSTTRVLEGRSGPLAEDDPASPTTAYGAANAANEIEWMSIDGTSVLRLTNFFAAPTSVDSPQSLLLPWSLVTEAAATGHIEVRSDPAVSREFVSADDVAAAIEVLAASDERPRVCWTSPGARMRLGELAETVGAGLVAAGAEAPTCTFGTDEATQPDYPAGWLAEHGWSTTLDVVQMRTVISAWATDQELIASR